LTPTDLKLFKFLPDVVVRAFLGHAPCDARSAEKKRHFGRVVHKFF